MAAIRAAHTSGLHHVGDQPSVFDIISQESLMKSLKPAVGHLVRYLAMAKPHRFAAAHRNYDELYLAFDLVLQNQYLKKYGASFAENFYGMKRIATKTGQMPTDLKNRVRSLAVLVLWPYVHDKLEKIHARLKEQMAVVGNQQQTLKTKMMKLFVVAWPWIKTLISVATTILQIMYMINRSSIHSPFLWFSGTRLEKLTPEDLSAFESIPMHLQQAGIINRLWRMMLATPGVFSRLFGYGLFFVQFIDFMYSSDLGAQLKKANSEWKVPPPPHKLLSESHVQMLDTNKCPLCMLQRSNDTVLSVSGYVFCYSCIDDHIKKHKSCPVTGLPATATQLIRLYTQ